MVIRMSDLERKVLKRVYEAPGVDEGQDAIASEIGEPLTGRVSVTLRLLERAGLIEAFTPFRGHGYRYRPGDTR